MANLNKTKNRAIFSASAADPSLKDRKRIFIKPKMGKKERADVIKWAAQNGYDTIVFPLGEKLNEKSEIMKLAKRCSLTIEAGGRDLSKLVPRSLFMFHRGLFRMEQGKRKKKHHFCPTNPKTTAIIAEQAKILFARSMKSVTAPRIFHLFPDEGFESIWCSCPACRAFTPSEQNIIAVNTAADVLLKLDPKARLSFLDIGTVPEEGIVPRKNMLKLVSKPSR